MAKIQFPALHSVVSVPLFAPPSRLKAVPPRRLRVRLDDGTEAEGFEVPPPPESDASFASRESAYAEVKDVTLRVKLVSSPKVRAISQAARALRQDERGRIATLKRTHTETEYPELYEPGFRTPEGEEAMATIMLDALTAMLAGLENVLIGDTDSGSITDVATLLGVLDMAGWTEIAGRVCMTAQTPDAKQVLS